MPRLGLVVVVLALALAPRAQSSHAEVVDAVIEAADLDALMHDLLGPMLQGMPGGSDEIFALDTLEDSLRTRLLADGRTADLRDVLAFLQSPANATMVAHGRRLIAETSDPAGALAFQERVAEQKKGALADEALVRRYQNAQGTTEMMPTMMTRMFEAVAQASPEFAAMMEMEGGMDALIGGLNEENMAEFTEGQVATMRVALYGVPRDVLAEVVTFAESEPGRYYARVGSEVAMDVMIPAFADFMAQMVGGMSQGGSEAPPPPPPPPPSPAEPEIYEVADVQPELIGGMEALANAIVYPEDARRAGIEGRVIVQFVVDERGAVTQEVVIRSPNELLSEAALAAIRQQRFVPGLQRGRPVKVRFALPVTFRLTGDGESAPKDL